MMRSKKRSLNKNKKKRNMKRNRILDGKNNSFNDIFQIVSLNGCPFCIEAKQILKQKGLKMQILEIDDMDTKKKWNTFVKKEFGRNHDTFPKIFYEGKFVGGLSELHKIFTHLKI